jgi:LmbE family N-acetylglucosaminyl deacetylase
MERRWRISPEDQQRWGSRRRQEAIEALARLGLSDDVMQFLGFHDQGCTNALLYSPAEAVEKFRRAIAEFQPTMLVGPSVHDRHPDHNALALLISMAVESFPADERPEVLHYLVHTRPERQPNHRIDLHLRSQEMSTKLQAIECHETQMYLSRKRFTAYAREVEQFYPDDAEDARHPIREMSQERGALCIRISQAALPIFNGELWIACDGQDGDRVRWRVPLTSRKGCVRIQGHEANGPARSATIRKTGNDLEVRIPLGPLSAASRLFVKLHRRMGFYDEAGWRELLIPARVPVLCPDLPQSEALFSSCSFAASYFGGGSESSA